MTLKTLSLLIAFMPILVIAQPGDSVLVYTGTGAFETRIIDLSNKSLEKIPFGSVDPMVEVLILDNNNLTEIPNWIATLKNLRSLSVRNNNLLEVNILIYCENLEELYLSGNKNLSDLPGLYRCKKLRLIDVTDTRINDVPIAIRGMENIGYFKYTTRK
jgi:Leucine-rich repeat (LRR) protein